METPIRSVPFSLTLDSPCQAEERKHRDDKEKAPDRLEAEAGEYRNSIG
jgi:hypothetical protein